MAEILGLGLTHYPGLRMVEIGARTRVVDYVESWVLNSNKCFAVFEA